MRNRTKATNAITAVLLLIIVSIAAFAVVQAQTKKTAATIGDLYTGNHIVIKLCAAPDIPLSGRGYVYVDGENLGLFNYALWERYTGVVVIYIWK
jgi:predicted acyltransferase